MMKLPNLSWWKSPALHKIVEALIDDRSEHARVVGGAVRNSLLGIDVSDIDLATRLRPEIVIEKLTAIGAKTIPTGIAHGTITAIIDGEKFEITTLRRDVSTDGRHATISFSDEWQDDATRRDFTINALYADVKTGQIYDYFGGIDDLNRRNLIFIGDANERIKEDYLRILRYFRFLILMDNVETDAATLAACAHGAPNLRSISRERISDEFQKILSKENIVISISAMQNAQIFDHFMPEIIPDAAEKIADLIKREKKLGISPKWQRRLAAILPHDPKLTYKIAARLKMSKKNMLLMAILSDRQEINDINVRKLAFEHGLENATDIALLYGHDDDYAAIISDIQKWEIPYFSLNGSQLIDAGIEKGPKVSALVKQIKNKWMDCGFPAGQSFDELVNQMISETKEFDKN
ncbi:CCA tRNA nucleotidyltransferase [Sphingorhabdus lutea]|nr:CCA tRNA nucleotidyltransferase [Sphingorhabdus lutea]